MTDDPGDDEPHAGGPGDGGTSDEASPDGDRAGLDGDEAAGREGTATGAEPDGLPAPFDEATLRAVAAATGVDAATLRRLVGEHQASLRRHASVTGWVYEIRRAYPRDALLARRPEGFYLAVEPTVWPEFESAIGATADELAALRELHDRVLRSAIDAPDDDREPMIVVR